jgi:hypothetical protein
MTIRVTLVDPVGTILDEIKHQGLKRDDVAATYAFIIRDGGVSSEDLRRVHLAIIDRWSLSALKYIKERAWKLVEGRA